MKSKRTTCKTDTLYLWMLSTNLKKNEIWHRFRSRRHPSGLWTGKKNLNDLNNKFRSCRHPDGPWTDIKPKSFE